MSDNDDVQFEHDNPYDGMSELEQGEFLAERLKEARPIDRALMKLREFFSILEKAGYELELAAKLFEEESEDRIDGCEPPPTQENMILSHAILNGVPRKLVLKIGKREGTLKEGGSTHDPDAALRDRHSKTRKRMGEWLAAKGSVLIQSRPTVNAALREFGDVERRLARGLLAPATLKRVTCRVVDATEELSRRIAKADDFLRSVLWWRGQA